MYIQDFITKYITLRKVMLQKQLLSLVKLSVIDVQIKVSEERGWDTYGLTSGNRTVWLAMNSYHVNWEKSLNDTYGVPHEWAKLWCSKMVTAALSSYTAVSVKHFFYIWTDVNFMERSCILIFRIINGNVFFIIKRNSSAIISILETKNDLPF